MNFYPEPHPSGHLTNWLSEGENILFGNRFIEGDLPYLMEGLNITLGKAAPWDQVEFQEDSGEGQAPHQQLPQGFASYPSLSLQQVKVFKEKTSLAW